MIQMHEEVEQALGEGRPVVALESAVMTHGLPQRPVSLDVLRWRDDWDDAAAANVALARAMQSVVRRAGAIPATIALIDGVLKIGVHAAELDRLAAEAAPRKISSRDLAPAMQQKATGGTTVAATLRACMLARPHPVRVMATGGIGGVHRGWPQHSDVSADLVEISRSPVCVVCAGAKSILDLRLTLEALESLAVPVIGYRTDAFPAFVLGVEPGLRCSARAETTVDVAAIARRHWNVVAGTGAVLVCQPLPQDQALDRETYLRALEQAEKEVSAGAGAAATPAILARMNELTGGSTLQANLSLLLSNALLAAEIGVALHPALGES